MLDAPDNVAKLASQATSVGHWHSSPTYSTGWRQADEECQSSQPRALWWRLRETEQFSPIHPNHYHYANQCLCWQEDEILYALSFMMFCSIHPKLILTNPNHPQCYGTQPASRPTQTTPKPTSVTPPALRSHLACPSDSQEWTWWTRTEQPSPARASLPLRHLGLTIPPRHPGIHPISASGSKTRPRSPLQPRLGSSYSNSSALLFPSRPWVSYSCMHPWSFALHPVPHFDALLQLQYIRLLLVRHLV